MTSVNELSTLSRSAAVWALSLSDILVVDASTTRHHRTRRGAAFSGGEMKRASSRQDQGLPFEARFLGLAFWGSPFGARLSGLALRGSPFGARLSGLAFRGSPFGARPSGLALRGSPFGACLSGLALRGSPFGARSSAALRTTFPLISVFFYNPHTPKVKWVLDFFHDHHLSGTYGGSGRAQVVVPGVRPVTVSYSSPTRAIAWPCDSV